MIQKNRYVFIESNKKQLFDMQKKKKQNKKKTGKLREIVLLKEGLCIIYAFGVAIQENGGNEASSQSQLQIQF